MEAPQTPTMRTLDAWSAARTIADIAREASEALYARYWSLSGGDGSDSEHLGDAARKQVARLHEAVALLDAAIAGKAPAEAEAA